MDYLWRTVFRVPGPPVGPGGYREFFHYNDRKDLAVENAERVGRDEGGLIHVSTKRTEKTPERMELAGSILYLAEESL